MERVENNGMAQALVWAYLMFSEINLVYAGGISLFQPQPESSQCLLKAKWAKMRPWRYLLLFNPNQLVNYWYIFEIIHY